MMKSFILAMAIAAPLFAQITSYPTSQIVSGQGSRSGPDCVAIGDSITARDDDAANNVHADSYINYAVLASGAKVRVVRNSGIGGNTTAQMLARFQTDVINFAPSCVAILGGTNDTSPITQTLPNIKAMVNMALSAGIRPILATIPPKGTAAISPPTVTATPSATGGTLAAGSYAYRVSATNSAPGETLASTEVTATTTGSTGSVVLTWPSVAGAAGYKIYGRTAGAELLLATNTFAGQGRPVAAYTDTGSATPSGALPSSNTTAVAITSTNRTLVSGANAAISAIAQAYSLPLVDFYSLLVDSTSGMYKTGYTIDGTHPTDQESKAMGVLWANTVANYLAPWKPYIAQDNADASVIYTNPLFTSNNGTNPTGWGPFGGSGAAESITTDAAVLGNVYVLNRTDATSRFNTSPLITGWSVGDVLAFSGYLKVVGADANGGQASISVQTNPSGQVCKLNFNSDTPGGWQPFYCEGAIAAGTTSIDILTGLNDAPVTLSMAQLTVRNLTALGVRPFVK